MSLPRMAIALGDPAGIGPEIALKAAIDEHVRQICCPVLVGDRRVLETHAELCGLGPEIASFRSERTARVPRLRSKRFGGWLPCVWRAALDLETVADRMIVHASIAFIAIAAAALAPQDADAAGPTLRMATGGGTVSVDRDALLARSDAVAVTIPHDVAYGRTMVYRAVPLADLLRVPNSADSVLEVEAKDGFVAQLPLDLVNNRDPRQAVAYIAIDTAAEPWPAVPGKAQSAGPFYVVWVGDRAASVPALDWPYQVVRMTVQDAPTKRWPALAVDARLAALDPARTGQSLFVSNCFTCHTLNRAGPAVVGPDLNVPMNPTEYLTEAGLRALIRDPRAVRAWPEQHMPGFPEEQLSDDDIGFIVDYLRHMAGRKTRPDDGGTVTK